MKIIICQCEKLEVETNKSPFEEHLITIKKIQLIIWNPFIFFQLKYP